MSYYNPITTIASVGTQSTPIPVTIASATEPTARENGGSLRQGDNWYNTDTAVDYIWITNADGSGGTWKIIGTGASGGDVQFLGGFVPNSILVGGSEANPNLSLLSNGGIVAEQTIEIRTPTDNGVSFVVKDRDESTGLRILGDGTLQTGMKTGDVSSSPDVGIQLNPSGTIEMGGSTLKVNNNTLFINDIAIIETTTLTTGNVQLTNPSAINVGYTTSSLTSLPDIGGLTTQEDYNKWGYAASEYLELNKLSDSPKDGLTYGRNNGAWTQISGITPKGSVPTITALDDIVNPQNGDLYVVQSNGHGYVYETGVWVDIGEIRGPEGPPGPTGNAATVTVGTTTTGDAGTNAAVSNSGTTSSAILDFTIPQGVKGDTGAQGGKGDTGAQGAAATVAAGTTVTGTPGTDADVSNSGSSSEAVFNFVIPAGQKGDTGSQGVKGDPGTPGTDGSSATVDAGTTTTLEPGNAATVTNVGSTSAATFNFGIPKGATGSKGDTGTAGAPGNAATISVGNTTTLNPGTDATVTNTGNTSAAVFDFGVPKGEKGDTGTAGAPGTAATLNAGTTTTGSAGSNAAVTNSGTSAAAVFDFVIPKGDTGAQGETGPAGTSIAIAGTVATVNDLPTTAPAGTMYIVTFDGNGYVSDGANPSVWTNVGQIQGPEGPVGPAGPVAGLNTQIVFNDNGTASGAADLTFANNTLSTNKISTTGDITVGSGGFYYGDGSKLLNISIPNSFTFKGDVDVVAGAAPTNDGAALDADDAGFFYLNTVAGSANSNFTGVTGNTFAKDQTLFWDGSAFFAGAQQSLNTTLLLTGGAMNDSGGGANGLITFADAQTFPATGIQGASTGQAGIVQLTNSLISTAVDLAPTAKSIKGVNDNLTTLTTTVSTNTTNISNNDADILSNTNNITTLTDNLAATDVKVADNITDISANTTAIANVKTTADDALSKSLGGTMQGNITMGGTTVVNFSDSQTFPGTVTELPAAGIGQAGIVQLTNSLEETSQTLAPTAKALADVYDVAGSASTTATAALPKGGGAMDVNGAAQGIITFVDDQDFPGTVSSPLPTASTSVAGIVQLSSSVVSDSEDLAATANAVKDTYARASVGIAAAADAQSNADAAKVLAEDALSKTNGGTMLSAIGFAPNQSFPASITEDYLPINGSTAMTGSLQVGTGTSKFTASTGGAINAYSAELSAAILVDTGTNESSIIPLFRGKAASKSRFIVESNGTVRIGDDLDMASESGGDKITLRADGTAEFENKVTSIATDASDIETTLATKGYVDTVAGTGGTGTVKEVKAGDGLTGGDITTTGTLSVLADGDTITVGADGVKVDTTKIPYPVLSVNEEIGAVVLTATEVGAIAKENGLFTGTITGPNITLSDTITADVLTITSDGNVTGTLTADKFVGDGAGLTGIVPTYVATTAPTGTHLEGELWYDNQDGILYVWYIDETQTPAQGQWVDVRPAGYVQSVISVNDRTGVVILTATDVGAVPLATFKSIVAASTDFADFQTKVAAL